MKKAQVALEFILFAILGIFVAIALTTAGIYLSNAVVTKQSAREAEDLAYSLQAELILADQLTTGYHRAITLPQTLRGQPYTVTSTKESLTITKNELTVTLAIPEINGTLQKGLNVITNEQRPLIITH